MKYLSVVSALVTLAAFANAEDCTLIPKKTDSHPPRKIRMDYSSANTYTGCFSMGEKKYEKAEFDHNQYKMEFYYDFGCAGEKHVVEKPGAIGDKYLHRSCRVVPLNATSVPCPIAPAPAQPAPAPHVPAPTHPAPAVNVSTPAPYVPQPPAGNYTPAPVQHPVAPAPPTSDCWFEKPSAPAVPASKQWSAVLFEEADYKGIKHWVDGTFDECRGLSGVHVSSVKNVAFPGADPIANPSTQTDAFTLAFYSDYGCKGEMVGAVTGDQPELCTMMDKCSEDSGYSHGDKGGDYGNKDVKNGSYGGSNVTHPINSTATSKAPVLPTKAPVSNGSYLVKRGLKDMSNSTNTTTNGTSGSNSTNVGDGSTKAPGKCMKPLSVKFVRTGVASKSYGGQLELKATDGGATGANKYAMGALGAVGITGLMQMLV
ncbi:hypothetical protein MP228_006829 [Amoeboaphelidium protococcarum]|nr:hypothetical protein MP228_006829 [Amoeboaphelidium protococcarum]